MSCHARQLGQSADGITAKLCGEGGGRGETEMAGEGWVRGSVEGWDQGRGRGVSRS